MTILIKNHPMEVKFISSNNGIVLYQRADSKVVRDEYLTNFYSRKGYQEEPFFHHKKKIYVNREHGYYVMCEKGRCYINNLMDNRSLKSIGVNF